MRACQSVNMPLVGSAAYLMLIPVDEKIYIDMSDNYIWL